MAILSKRCKPDNFESHNSLKLSETFLESNSPDILALCETNLDDSTASGNFSVTGYLPLTKDSIAHMQWSCSLRERRTSFYMGIVSRKPYRFLLMFSTGFTSISVLLLFPLSMTFFDFMQFLIPFHLT